MGIDDTDEGSAGTNSGDNDEQAERLPSRHQVSPVVLHRFIIKTVIFCKIFGTFFLFSGLNVVIL